jgi:myo-inositol-1(or 4)-monophosphatase
MRGVFAQTAVKAATEAGKIILSKYGKQLSIKSKGKTDLVTDVDKKTQAIIIKTIKKKFPDHAFLSEELDKQQGKSDYLWIIDPLDGTANYSAGIPYFCTSIALAYKNEIIAGVVFDPLHKNMYVAEKGKGAFCNNKRIHVSRRKSLNKSLIGADSGHVKRHRSAQKMAKLIDNVRGIRWQGAAALSLCFVASGKLEAYFTASTTPWDMGAGSIILTEAGGKATEVDGKPRNTFSRSMLASNKLLHTKILNRIK